MAGQKTVGNVTVTFDTLDLSANLDDSSIEGVVAEAETTTYASEGQEAIPTLPSWSVPVSGLWSKALDDKFGPAATTPPTAANRKTLTVDIAEEGGAVITYTWTTAAFLTNYSIQFGSPTAAIRWTGTLRGSGNAVRTIV